MIETAARRTGAAEVTVTVSDGLSASEVALAVHAGGRRGDALVGTAGADLLLGQGGDDELDGREGNDVLCGGRGHDTLTGGAGADLFSGGKGRDVATDVTPADGDTTDGTVG